MSSDLNKRIAELERQLHEAQEARYNILDHMDTDSTQDLQESVHVHEDNVETGRAKLDEMAETQQKLNEALEVAKAAADNIPNLTEQASAAADIALSRQGALDEVMMAVHVTEAKLSDLENAQHLLEQELELAKTNEEYVGGLEKKITSVSEEIAALSADLQEASDLKATCEQDLFQALKSRQQLTKSLDEAYGQADSILHIENTLIELNEVMTEEQYRVEANDNQAGELRQTIEQRQLASESFNDDLEAYDARIKAISAELSEAWTQLDQLLAEESQVSDTIINVLDAIDKCTQYGEIYKLEEAFNTVGMTLQKTSNDRMILCRCVDNKIVTENVIDDFIFVGPAKRLHEGVINKIKSFVMANEGAACAPAHEPVVIMNEDKKFSLDFLVESERSL